MRSSQLQAITESVGWITVAFLSVCHVTAMADDSNCRPASF